MAAGAMGVPSLPPIPPETGGPGMDPNAGASAFSGGMPAMMQSIQQIEMGAKTLVTQLPSLAPLVADFISKLRVAVPNAVGAGAGMAAPGGEPTGEPGLPPPPMQGA